MGIPLSTLITVAPYSITIKSGDSSKLCESLWLRAGAKWYLLLVILELNFRICKLVQTTKNAA